MTVIPNPFSTSHMLTSAASSLRQTYGDPVPQENEGGMSQKDRYWRWPNFTRHEMACRHCGAFYYWPDFMDRLQDVRNAMCLPLHVLSAHRCAIHNASVGGAPFSQHLKLAADLSVRGHDRATLREACHAAGFTGFGYYTTFLHIDLGPSRHWYGAEKTKDLWQIY